MENAGNISPPRDRRAKNDIPPQPRKQLVSKWTYTGTAPFTDHSNKQGIAVYWGHAPSSDKPILPPLWSFQFYLTYEGVSVISAAEEDLPMRILKKVMGAMPESYPLRLDINFLPNATVEDCMSHYRAEKSFRLKEGKMILVTDRFDSEGRGNFSFLVMVEFAKWEVEGATTVLFDWDGDVDVDEPGFVPVSVKRGVKWGDLERPKPVDAKAFVGEVLHNLMWTDAWHEAGDAYDEALEQGRSEWS